MQRVVYLPRAQRVGRFDHKRVSSGQQFQFEVRLRGESGRPADQRGLGAGQLQFQVFPGFFAAGQRRGRNAVQHPGHATQKPQVLGQRLLHGLGSGGGFPLQHHTL